MRTITANQIANMYTLVQIQEQIATYQSMLDSSLQGSYSLDTTQGRHSVTTSDPQKVESLLAVWMKAHEIKTGTYTGAQLTHVNYTPGL
jgi:hypothetical protein